MKKKNNLFYILTVLVSFISCQKQDSVEDIQNPPIERKENFVEYNKEMNVLNFTNRENVKMFIDSYEKNEGQIASFYEEGFLPYEPIEKIDEKQYNELLLARRNVINASNYLSMSMSSRRPSLDVDEDEEDYELIKNDKFSSLLNAKGEIQVGDSIYRYTEEGVYIVKADKQKMLDAYLESKKSIGSVTSRPSSSSGTQQIGGFIRLYTPRELDSMGMKLHSGNPYPFDYGEEKTRQLYDAIRNQEFPLSTSHYNTCVNEKASWIDNIFGRSYVCEYKFKGGKRKLRTTFAVEDYYLFTDVYAQAKFKQKTWLGWYSSRDAKKVYLKINEANLSFDERRLKLKISVPVKDLEKFYTEVQKIINNSYHKVAVFVSNVFRKDDNSSVVIDYTPSLEEIASAAQSSQPIIPQTFTPKYNVSFDFTGFFENQVKEVVVVTAMGKNFGVKNTDIMRQAYSLFNQVAGSYSEKPKGLIVLQNDIDTNEIMVASYKITNEIEEVRGLAVASRTFKIPQNVRLNELTIGYSVKGSSQSIGLGIDTSWRKVNKVSLDIETGAFYDGEWGGSKFIISE